MTTNNPITTIKKNSTVHELRKQGHKVEVIHRRRYFDPINKRYTFLSEHERFASQLPDFVQPEIKGGVTTVRITFNHGGNDVIGVAECSKKDAYIRKYGVNKALGRALAQAI